MVSIPREAQHLGGSLRVRREAGSTMTLLLFCLLSLVLGVFANECQNPHHVLLDDAFLPDPLVDVEHLIRSASLVLEGYVKSITMLDETRKSAEFLFLGTLCAGYCVDDIHVNYTDDDARNTQDGILHYPFKEKTDYFIFLNETTDGSKYRIVDVKEPKEVSEKLLAREDCAESTIALKAPDLLYYNFENHFIVPKGSQVSLNCKLHHKDSISHFVSGVYVMVLESVGVSKEGLDEVEINFTAHETKNFTCTSIWDNKTISMSSVLLEVLDTPYLNISQHHISNLTYDDLENVNVTWPVSFIGFPDPEFQLINPDGSTEKQGSCQKLVDPTLCKKGDLSLTLTADQHDHGEFTLTARAGELEMNVSLILNLTNPTPPQWATNDTKINTTTPILHKLSATLNCTATAVPSPTYTWRKNEEEIEQEENFVEITDSGSVLNLLKLREQDCGLYVCRASNRAGELSGWFELVWSEAEVRRIDRGTKTVETGVLVTLSIFLFLAMTWIAYKRGNLWFNSRKYRLEAQKEWLEGKVEAMSPSIDLQDQALLLPYNRRFEVSKNNIVFDKLLGCGAFGRVYRAELTDPESPNPPLTVAVKMVKSRKDKAQSNALQSELKILIHIGRHVNIVNLVAACTKDLHTKGELMILVEYCRFGNILDFMRRNQKNFVNQLDPEADILNPSVVRLAHENSNGNTRNSSAEAVYISEDRVAFQNVENTATCPGLVPNSQRMLLGSDAQGNDNTAQRSQAYTNFDSHMTTATMITDTHDMETPGITPDPENREKPLCSRDLLCWAFQVARGMDYLSFKKVLHGDLAARNVLLCDKNTVKISDFGLAKDIYKEDNYRKSKNAPLPVKWMSIEAIRDGIFSTQSDIWAFGVVMWEIFSLGRSPFPGIVVDENFIKKLESGMRMEKPRFSTEALYQLMRDCWRPEPMDRPPFGDLEKRLGRMLDEGDKAYFDQLHNCFEEEIPETEEQSCYLDMVLNPTYNHIINHHPAEQPSQQETSGALQPLLGDPGVGEAKGKGYVTLASVDHLLSTGSGTEEYGTDEAVETIYSNSSVCLNPFL